MIALIAIMFFSMYRLNPNLQRPRELTQIEFFKKVDDGKVVRLGLAYRSTRYERRSGRYLLR